MEFVINGEKVKADLSAYTFVVYEQEFGSDLLADVLGKVAVNDDDTELYLDFTQTSWSKVSRAAWAMAKTVDESIPSYNAWAKNAREFNMFELNTIIGEAISDAFFHETPAAEEGSGKAKSK